MSLSVLFLGDSITAEFNFQQFFMNKDFLNRAVSGDSTIECLERLEAALFEKQFNIVFLCIGTNDLAQQRSDIEILINIEKITKKIKAKNPDCRIVLTSLFPTRNNEPRPNERIRNLNKNIEKLSYKLNAYYFNLHPHFTDDDGNLRKEFTDDGLHLTNNAYQAWSIELSKYLNDNFNG